MTDEHRLVFWEGRLVAHAPYYDVDSTLEHPATVRLPRRRSSAPRSSRRTWPGSSAAGYTVIEINDGGCSVFPEQMDPRDFYGAVLG